MEGLAVSYPGAAWDSVWGERNRLHAIVEELAKCGEPLDREMGDCVLCGNTPDWYAPDPAKPWMRISRFEDHAVDCPWRMAVEALR